MDVIDRVFGSCFRSWAVKENVGDNKYIDYLPTRKWKYSDHNLMKDLSENNPSDVLDLSDDPRGQTSSNMQLRLHENVFLNPVSETSSQDAANESTESEEIIMEHTPQINIEQNNNTIKTSNKEKSTPSPETLLSIEVKIEPYDASSLSINNESSSEEEDADKLSKEALLPESDQTVIELPESDQVAQENDQKVPVTVNGYINSEDENERKLSEEALIPSTDYNSGENTTVNVDNEPVENVGGEIFISNSEDLETVNSNEIKEDISPSSDKNNDSDALISNEIEASKSIIDPPVESEVFLEEKLENGYHHSEDKSEDSQPEATQIETDISISEELSNKLKEHENVSGEITSLDNHSTY